MDDALRPAPGLPCNPGGDSVLVLGIGNLLWSDEGFGVRCVEALRAGWDFGPQVELVDGGTQGLYLLPLVQQATHLLILDAVDYGMAPGTLKVVDDEEVPRFLGAKKMSLHQTGFQEVLMLAQMTDSYPRHVRLIGCQPEVLEDYGGSLRPCVKAALDAALPMAIDCLRDWGATPQPRSGARGEADGVNASSLSLAAYEAGRPSEQDACRIGDPRFLVGNPSQG
jgi:hydrogenase maturation protease